jgi:peptidoglycan-N-acetylglucosamine deacetylase
MLAASRLDYTVVLWSQLVLERQLSAEENVRSVVAGAGPGSVILVHDGGPVPNGRGLRAMPEIIDRLTRAGYRFVTVSELLAAEAGRSVSSGKPAGDELARGREKSG